MKKSSALLAASAVIATAISFSPMSFAAETYRIDPDHTTVAFSVNHLGFSNISGRFSDVVGKITLDSDNYSHSKVTININSASINTAHDKRDEHLSSQDFFDVGKFSQMTFNSTQLTKTGDKIAVMVGDLTLLGITKNISLDVTFNKQGHNPFIPENYVAGFSAKGVINRSDFGMNFGVPMIADQVELNIELEAIRID